MNYDRRIIHSIMSTPISKIFFFLCVLCSGTNCYSQFISRDVIANSAETYTSPNLILTTILGEPYGELLANPGANLFFTTGFAQPDIDVQTTLSTATRDALLLYPNPAVGGTIKLAFNHVPDGIYTVSLIDASGKAISSQNVTYSLGAFAYLPIDVSRLSSGMYFIRVYNRINFQAQVKLIKI